METSREDDSTLLNYQRSYWTTKLEQDAKGQPLESRDWMIQIIEYKRLKVKEISHKGEQKNEKRGAQ